jgi:hypothetical protein
MCARVYSADQIEAWRVAAPGRYLRVIEELVAGGRG